MRTRNLFLVIISFVVFVLPIQSALSLNVGRDVLALYKSSEGQTEKENEIFFYLSQPLKEMGLSVRYWDIDRGIREAAERQRDRRSFR